MFPGSSKVPPIHTTSPTLEKVLGFAASAIAKLVTETSDLISIRRTGFTFYLVSILTRPDSDYSHSAFFFLLQQVQDHLIGFFLADLEMFVDLSRGNGRCSKVRMGLIDIRETIFPMLLVKLKTRHSVHRKILRQFNYTTTFHSRSTQPHVSPLRPALPLLSPRSSFFLSLKIMQGTG